MEIPTVKIEVAALEITMEWFWTEIQPSLFSEQKLVTDELPCMSSLFQNCHVPRIYSFFLKKPQAASFLVNCTVH